jgi:membrane protein YqaA with SNARE-associated domain
MLRRLYDWVMSMAEHRHALPLLGAVSFAESSFFPIPPDVLVVPMVLARPKRAWIVASVCTVASVLGGLAGYAIGALLFETLGRPIIEFYGLDAQFATIQERYNALGAWIVFAAGFTPIPYKVFTIASGVTGLDIVVFTLASVLSRGGRFFLEAGLLYFFGAPIRVFIEKWLPLLTFVFLALLISGFFVIKFVL